MMRTRSTNTRQHMSFHPSCPYFLMKVFCCWLVLALDRAEAGFISISKTDARGTTSPLFSTRKRTNAVKSRRMVTRKSKKKEMDSMLMDMGLKPVIKSEKAKAKQDQSNVKIPVQIQLNYSRNGHSCLRSLLDPDLLKELKIELQSYAESRELQAWQQKTEVTFGTDSSSFSVKQCQDALGEMDLPFLQHFNTWKQLNSVKQLACDSMLPQYASILMDIPRVRLYQDSLFWKRSSDGCTPWHVDGRMMPFDTSNSITFWIPLQTIPADGSALEFVSKSHSDFALAFWNDFDSSEEYQRLEERYRNEGIVHYMPMALGDVTVHSGWTLHCTSAGQERLALAITYVDANAEIRHDAQVKRDTDTRQGRGYGDNEDYWSYKDWVDDVTPRQPFQHAAVPTVWPPPANE